MNYKPLSFLIAVVVLAFAHHSYAQPQNTPDAEAELSSLYDRMLTPERDDADSLSIFSERYAAKLTAYITKNPGTLNNAFQSLVDKNALRIATSPDGLLRIYSWDNQLGGTMRYFNNIYQYKTNGKVHAEAYTSNNNAGDFYSEIFSLKANHETYYLAVANGIYSTKDVGQSVRVLSIAGGKADNVKLIKTTSGLTNSIRVAYDFFSVVDRPERPVRLIKYDMEKKILYIPIVLEDGKVTDRFILYQFTGKYFEKILTQKKAGQSK